MGCFSYLCNKCGLNLRDGERVVLRHVRHGEILGETIGEYESYGRVYEDDTFRSWSKEEKSHLNINSHEEICKSEFDFFDSIGRQSYDVSNRNFEGQQVGLGEYLDIRRERDGLVTMEDVSLGNATDFEGKALLKAISEYNNLPFWEEEFVPKSGVVAFHSKCYCSLKDNPEDNALKIKPSEQDPEQGCGNPRKRFL